MNKFIFMNYVINLYIKIIFCQFELVKTLIFNVFIRYNIKAMAIHWKLRSKRSGNLGPRQLKLRKASTDQLGGALSLFSVNLHLLLLSDNVA